MPSNMALSCADNKPVEFKSTKPILLAAPIFSHMSIEALKTQRTPSLSIKIWPSVGVMGRIELRPFENDAISTQKRRRYNFVKIIYIL